MTPNSFIFVSSFMRKFWGWLIANLSASRRSLLDDYQTFTLILLKNPPIILREPGRT
jgi:hypothetical protein